MELQVLSLFTGIGAFEKALSNIGIAYKLIGFSEIDKYAIESYCAIHNVDKSLNLGDITKIDKEKLPRFIDLITHGSPCQDFSVAGKQAGGDKGTNTRSSLMWNTVDIIEWCLPKYVVWENVKNLLSKKHKHNFESYIEIMDKLGYNSYYQVLNAKDYGIPQNRERIYTISIRKDVDKGTFIFPRNETLQLRLKDMLEEEVDEKYYLDDKKISKIKNSNFMQEKKRIQEKDYCDTILARDWKDPKCIQVGTLDMKGINQIKRFYSPEGLSPTLTTMGGGNTEPKIQVIGNYMPSNYDASRVVDSNGLAPTVKENHGTITATNIGVRIRKLTPKECWRLMGFSDNDYENAAYVPTSNTQLYKQAGNSIVVPVLEKIFIKIFKEGV